MPVTIGDISESEQNLLDSLLRLEAAIIVELLKGDTNKQIALTVGTTEQVVKNYLSSVYNKTGMDTRLEVAMFFARHPNLEAALYEKAERLKR